MRRPHRRIAIAWTFGTAALAILTGAAVWAGLARAEDAKGDKAAAEALKALKGTWVGERDGQESRWAFDGEKLKAMVNGLDYECKVKVDPGAKPHPSIDFIIEDGPEDSKGKTSRSIYKLDGEALTLCVALPDRDRPTDFETVEDEAFVFELKKEKAKAQEEKPADR